MKRTLFAVGVGTVAVAILVLMALESSPISASVHIAQNTLRNELNVVVADYQAFSESLQSAWDDKQVPGEATRALIERTRNSERPIESTLAEIPGSDNQRSRIENSFLNFSAANDHATQLATELHEETSAYVASLAVLRDTGPRAVQTLRDLGLSRAATDTFELVMGTLEFASSAQEPLRLELQQLRTSLARDLLIDANLPREMAALQSATEIVLETGASIESKLGEFRSSPVIGLAEALQTAVSDSYATSVNRRDRARLLLMVYALVLLAAVGLIAWRLKASYREVADANENLSSLNENLEQRVEDRTKELEGTLGDLKESQVQLVQAEKMSSLGQLVAGISHEINTPLLYLANNVVLIEERLQQIQSFVQRSLAAYGMQPGDFESRAHYQQAFAAALNELKQVLDKNELDADIAEARDLLEDCGAGLKDLTEMAQSLKDFSRLDRAPVGNFNVNDGLDKTLVIAKNMIKHKAHVTKYYGDVPEIACSPSKINQVFLNLISNAAQAIEGNGEIALRTERYGDDAVAISVSDTGCGIPDEILEKIRDPFFTTKEVGSGTGLGLSIVDEIIRSHGGELTVESEVGRGSKFTVILPLAAKPQSQPTEITDAFEQNDESVDAQTDIAIAEAG